MTLRPPLLFTALAALLPLCAAGASPLNYNRDVRPILSENCFHCHGQDPKNREADLRLDSADGATRDLGGYFAIVPGKPEESELVARIFSKDRTEVMPPPKSNRHLSPEQADILRRWVAEGAKYEKHWAFLPIPPMSDIPVVGSDASDPITSLVRGRLQSEGLQPSAPAAPEAWLRRVTLDLTGLPPTPAELDAFLADQSGRGEAAYAAVADRLLASPRYGERMASDWLDAARYADTHGFNNDSSRSMWRWRDWVIDAFNSNLPYDRFITEQLAGDLLPNPTLENRLATGFGRNHVINSEGGIIDEEYRVEYVADRVRTLCTAWLGLTMECARCHDHKFDPVTQRDYYGLFAFFNNLPEHGEDGRVANAVPMIPAPTREQQGELRKLSEELQSLEAKLAEARQASESASPQPEPEGDLKMALALHLPADSAEVQEKTFKFTKDAPELLEGVLGKAWQMTGGNTLVRIEAGKLDFGKGLSFSAWVRPRADNPADVALLSSASYSGSRAQQGFGKGQEIRLVNGELEVRINEFYPAYSVQVRSEGSDIRPEEWQHLVVTYEAAGTAAGVRMFVDGREVGTRTLYDDLSTKATGSPAFQLGADLSTDAAAYRGDLDEVRIYQRVLPRDLVPALFTRDARPYAEKRRMAGLASARELRWLADSADGGRELREKRDAVAEKVYALRRSFPTVMVMSELPEPRPAFVLKRGAYDAPGEPVSPQVPEQVIAPWPSGASHNRLGLAQWLTQPHHPLTARVVVNRFWAQLFGTGLVKTLEDFGYQGEYPSHPELLDWLARRFIDSGWDVKALMRTIVLSGTYRQTSHASPALYLRDPENRLLARGPRVRLPAEVLRDQALAVSGLLREHIGGPSVYPYQPEGLYKGLVVGADYPGTKWIESTGDDLFRRSLYTFWKRTVPHPVMLTFDSPDREFCTVRRSRTNTPLQALILMNEPAFVQAGQHLGKRVYAEGGADDTSRLRFAFRAVTSRYPTEDELKELQRALEKARASFARQPESAARIAFADPNASEVERAVWATVGSLLLNLDETVTKE